MRPVWRIQLLFVDRGVALVEALDDAAELYRRHVRSCRTRSAGEGERVLRARVGNVDYDDFTRLQLQEQDLLREQILDIALDRATQRTSAEYGIEAALGDQRLRRGRELDAHVLVLQPDLDLS